MAKGFASDEREVQVRGMESRENFILGKKNMPFYYRGKVKVSFEPMPELAAVSIKPNTNRQEEEELFEYARRLMLEPEKVGEQILENNVRVFRFKPNVSDDNKTESQRRLAEHRLVVRVGAIVRLDQNSISFLTNELIVKFKANITKEEVLV